ncbi:MAG: Gx transporter family protein [Clostridia bacterium]|nr:Gx transporter family protein [Clostridia bacterium]
MKRNTKILAALSVTVAVAMLLSFIESRLPTFVPIPGVKLGLANVAVIFAMYKLGEGPAAGVSLVRVGLSALLFGSVASLIYSLSGAVLSFALMVLSRRVFKLHTVGVSIIGGVAHNAGQIIAAAIVMGTASIIYYLPFLILSGTLAGIAIGLISNELTKRIKI